VLDPDTGQLISKAHVAEVEYTAFADDKRYAITAGRRPPAVVRRRRWSGAGGGQAPATCRAQARQTNEATAVTVRMTLN